MSDLRRYIAGLTLILTCWLHASEPITFEDAAQEERFRTLTSELRCLVCQNQSLADSDALLAHDLREEIFEMMVAGRSDAEIRQFMVDRYGDFVLYRPPVQANTLLLWAAPLLLLLIGGMVIFTTIRKRNALFAAADGADETAGRSDL